MELRAIYKQNAETGQQLESADGRGSDQVAAVHADLAVLRMEHFAKILDAVIAHPGLTADELAGICQLGRDQIGYRIIEMLKVRLLILRGTRVCTVSGHNVPVIYATSRALEELKGERNGQDIQ